MLEVIAFFLSGRFSCILRIFPERSAIMSFIAGLLRGNYVSVRCFLLMIFYLPGPCWKCCSFMQPSANAPSFPFWSVGRPRHRDSALLHKQSFRRFRFHPWSALHVSWGCLIAVGHG